MTAFCCIIHPRFASDVWKLAHPFLLGCFPRKISLSSPTNPEALNYPHVSWLGTAQGTGDLFAINSAQNSIATPNKCHVYLPTRGEIYNGASALEEKEKLHERANMIFPGPM